MNLKNCFLCYKKKQKSGFMNIMNKKIINVPYLIFLDEHYYYMAKDKIVNQKHQNLRRVGNKYDLFKLNNFQVRKENEDFEFTFEFVTNDIFSRITKVLYFTPKEAEDFYAVLNVYLGRLGISPPEIRDDDEEGEENEGEENEDEEGEEEEDEGEEEGKEAKKEEDQKEESNNEKKENENEKVNVDNKEESEKNVAEENYKKEDGKEKQD